MRHALLGLLLLTACSQPAAAPTPAPAPAPTSPSAPAGASAPRPGGVLLTLAPDGSEVRFRVREQLARRNLPSEAIGRAREVDGGITLGPDGAIADDSKISVRLDSLATDERQRDRFIKDNTLQTRRFPMAEFVPKSVAGLAWPLPTDGTANFQLTGDLTVHGVTRPVTWAMTAQFAPGEVSGSGTTQVTLEQFGMQKPSVMSVLSIDDAIALEIDFRAVRED